MKSAFSLILLGFMAGLAIAGAKTPVASQPPLVPSEQVWIYGYIPKDGWVSHHYFLTNPHKDTITIKELIPGCDCTYLPKGPITIPPGGTYLLESTFDTRTYFGETNRDIHIVTDFAPNPEMDLYFLSVVDRQPGSVEIAPTSTAFIEGKETQTFKIKNLSDDATHFVVHVDNDSLFTVSQNELSSSGKGEVQFTATPIWDRIHAGTTHTCIVVDVIRDKELRITIPITVSKY